MKPTATKLILHKAADRVWAVRNNLTQNYSFKIIVIILLIFLYIKGFDISISFSSGIHNMKLYTQNHAIDNAQTDVKKTHTTLPIQSTATLSVVPNVSDPDYLAKTTYIHRFQDIAIAEMKKYHIPASIILAQGILETRAGHSQLALKNNNHFGIKCFSKTCKKGHCSNFTDDSHKDFFVIYKTAWESYRAHSILLVSPKYKHLQVYEKDYKKWATGLQTAGYATAKNYAQSLIQLIEQYNLHKYDFL